MTEKNRPDAPGAASRDTAGATATFISEGIGPEGNDFALPPAIGEPALPLRFTWRQQTHEVRTVRRRWKELDPDRTHGGSELYLRRHWFELLMDDGAVWTVYFQRQPASRRSAKARWWLYSLGRLPESPST